MLARIVELAPVRRREVLDDPAEREGRQVHHHVRTQGRPDVPHDGVGQRLFAQYPTADQTPSRTPAVRLAPDETDAGR